MPVLRAPHQRARPDRLLLPTEAPNSSHPSTSTRHLPRHGEPSRPRLTRPSRNSEVPDWQSPRGPAAPWTDRPGRTRLLAGRLRHPGPMGRPGPGFRRPGPTPHLGRPVRPARRRRRGRSRLRCGRASRRTGGRKPRRVRVGPPPSPPGRHSTRRRRARRPPARPWIPYGRPVRARILPPIPGVRPRPAPGRPRPPIVRRWIPVRPKNPHRRGTPGRRWIVTASLRGGGRRLGRPDIRRRRRAPHRVRPVRRRGPLTPGWRGRTALGRARNAVVPQGPRPGRSRVVLVLATCPRGRRGRRPGLTRRRAGRRAPRIGRLLRAAPTVRHGRRRRDPGPTSLPVRRSRRTVRTCRALVRPTLLLTPGRPSRPPAGSRDPAPLRRSVPPIVGPRSRPLARHRPGRAPPNPRTATAR